AEPQAEDRWPTLADYLEEPAPQDHSPAQQPSWAGTPDLPAHDVSLLEGSTHSRSTRQGRLGCEGCRWSKSMSVVKTVVLVTIDVAAIHTSFLPIGRPCASDQP